MRSKVEDRPDLVVGDRRLAKKDSNRFSLGRMRKRMAPVEWTTREAISIAPNNPSSGW